MRDFLASENERNKRHCTLYGALMQRALGKVDIFIGHHLCFENMGNLATEQEIPSADTLLFDHDIMSAVFGNRAVEIMQHLARTPVDSRDIVLEVYMGCLQLEAA